MSKYKERGAYHYEEFKQDTPYRHHMLDVISKVGERVPPEGRILDVGCGEGLTMRELSKLGYRMLGCDTDRVAVDLGNNLGNVIRWGTVLQFLDTRFDAVLSLDSLEHMKDPKEAVDRMKTLAPIVIIAVPSEHDRHAERQIQPAEVQGWFESSNWHRAHFSTRHARHLFVFEATE